MRTVSIPHVLHIRFPWRLQQIKASSVYIIASLRVLRGNYQGAAARGAWMLRSYPAFKGTPRLDSGLRAGHRSDPPGDCSN